jgi:hypothetical protein
VTQGQIADWSNAIERTGAGSRPRAPTRRTSTLWPMGSTNAIGRSRTGLVHSLLGGAALLHPWKWGSPELFHPPSPLRAGKFASVRHDGGEMQLSKHRHHLRQLVPSLQSTRIGQ